MSEAKGAVVSGLMGHLLEAELRGSARWERREREEAAMRYRATGLSADGGVIFELSCSSLEAVGDTIKAVLTHLPVTKHSPITIRVESFG